MRHTQRGISYLARLLAEYGAEQPLLGGKLGLALGRNLAHEYIARRNLGAYTYYSAFVKILERIFADIRNIPCDLFRSELCISRLKLIFLDMDRCIHIVTHKTLVYKNRVLVVVAFPCHKSDKCVSAERNLAAVRSRSVGDNLFLLNLLTDCYYRTLIYTGSVV